MMKTEMVSWTRTHLLIALNLYCKIPYGKFHNRNPMIADVASRMGRTTNSLAMKLSNFASLDPVHRARGIKGPEGASQQDRQLWNEFRENPELFMPESEQLLHDLYTTDQEKEVDIVGAEMVRVASHIRPWRSFPEDRLNLRNGLCLSAIHDAAFDQGLLTLDDQFRVVLSRALHERMHTHEWRIFFGPYEGQKITLPSKLAEPDPMALEYHRTHVFEEL
jgi:putative restriction endonuclease